jgi:hypothetical protein
VGAALGVTEDAARVRVNRALDKLRALLAKQGIKFGATAIATAVAANAVSAAPATLAASTTNMVISGSVAASVATLIITSAKSVVMTTLKTAAVASVIVAAVGIGIYQFGPTTPPPAVTVVTSQNHALGLGAHALVLHLPAPKVTPEPAAPISETKPVKTPARATNLLAQIMGDNISGLTTEQAKHYLQANGRTAETLLAAFKTSHNSEFLRDAMREFPNDPQVAFAAVLEGNLSFDEQRQWLDKFKNIDPNNALPNYLSALAWFNAENTDMAAEELLASAGKKNFKDYTVSSLPDIVQAYLSAGYSETEAQALANLHLTIGMTLSLRQLGQDMLNMANGYRQSGDEASAQSILLITANLGQYYADSSSLTIPKLFGGTLATKALQALPSEMVYGENGQTVQDAVDRINEQKTIIIQLIRHYNDFITPGNVSEPDILHFFKLKQENGEISALQWLANQKAKH